MMYDIQNLTYPTSRTVSDVVDRIVFLAACSDENVQACLADANGCLTNHQNAVPFPGGLAANRTDRLPTSWLDSASTWVDRALMYSHGVFNVPAWW